MYNITIKPITESKEELEAINWANEQIEQLKLLNTGFGLDAIQANYNLERLAQMTNEELVRVAIKEYKLRELN